MFIPDIYCALDALLILNKPQFPDIDLLLGWCSIYMCIIQSESGGSNATWQVKWKPLYYHRSTILSFYQKKSAQLTKLNLLFQNRSVTMIVEFYSTAVIILSNSSTRMVIQKPTTRIDEKKGQEYIIVSICILEFLCNFPGEQFRWWPERQLFINIVAKSNWSCKHLFENICKKYLLIIRYCDSGGGQRGSSL